MKSEWFKKWDDSEYDREYWSRTSEVEDTEETEETSSSSGWWDRFHGSGKKSSYTPVKSTSAYLRSTSSWDWAASSRSSNKDNMLEVLKEINKTINLTVNSEDGKSEKNLTVRYSNGYVKNDLTSDVLYISPEVMLDKDREVLDKSTDDYYSGLDALNGQAMLCSFMRKSVSSTANSQYKNCSNWAIRNIFMTDLQTTAGNEIRDDWPGFHSYIEQQHRTFAASKESVVSALMSPDQNIDNFINLLCYNRLSNDRLDYDAMFEPNMADCMSKADALFNETLDKPVDKNNRFNRASDLFAGLQNILNLSSVQPPECSNSNGKKDSSNSDNDGGDNDGSNSDNDNDSSNSDNDGGDNDGGDSSQGQGKIKVSNIDLASDSKLDRRFTGDNSYNISNIAGDIDSSEINPNDEIQDRPKKESDKLSEIHDTQIDSAVYRRLVPAVNASTRSEYKDFVRNSRSAINNVKNCFQFHNTDFSLSTYGLASGSMDDGSFHKVFLGESERLYERRDVQARKKWLVTVLIDQSGSMDQGVRSSTGGYKTRIQEARELSIIFAEALKSLKEVDFGVYGFTTTGNVINTFCYQDKQTKKLEALIEAGYHNGTGIGFHISHVGDKMLSQYPDYENKILFVITDGEPNMTPTPTMNGYQHTNHCCELLRKRGIKVFGIGIANAFNSSIGNQLFGSNNFVVINDVKSTLNVLTNSLRNFFKKMKK